MLFAFIYILFTLVLNDRTILVLISTGTVRYTLWSSFFVDRIIYTAE